MLAALPSSVGTGWGRAGGGPPAGGSNPLPAPLSLRAACQRARTPSEPPRNRTWWEQVPGCGQQPSCPAGPVQSLLSFRAVLPLNGPAWGCRWGPTRELSAHTVPGSFQAHPGPSVWDFSQPCKH